MMKKDREAYKKLVRARAGLLLNHPFFGHLSLRMKLIEDRTCDTAWSDGKTLAYNPAYINILPPEKLEGLMGHVVMHPACRHHLRRHGRDARQWNIACDYAINWILMDAGLTLPDGYLDDPALQGQTADRIYRHLFTDKDGNRSNNQEGPAQNRPSPGEEEEDPPELTEVSGTASAQADREDETDASEETARIDTSQANENRTRSDHGDPGKSGEVRDAPTSEKGAFQASEDTTDENQWLIDLAQAAANARSMGDLPGALERMIEDILSPKLDWRHLLWRFIQNSARCDYAWMPPNRRYVQQGFYLPSMRSDELPEIVIAVDTSGSVSEKELNQFGAEISGILETFSATVHLLYCDMRIIRSEALHRQDLPLSLSASGGGGTDFRPAFQWVEEEGLDPMCMIYLTDLACDLFPEEPPYPVIWAYTGEEAKEPPFGEYLSMEQNNNH
jgi:predicted metal-dependent peptidase